MSRIWIGVHVHAEPQRLQATLASLRAHTGPAFALLLLPDGPDAATTAALTALRALPQSGTVTPRGVAACFNRLAAAALAAGADALVLLESGALVGPGWLDRLLAALAADPRNGLAGPSTNAAWNEQAAFPRASAAPADLARTAQEAARRFGDTTRTLEPLHSLSDFCYAVRREVVEAIGGADEGYGLGPCWEMDYNIRAARAGFRGVWVRGAYVQRAPFTARRQREEALRFAASKARYQDKFCALRLRGERAGYEPHCRGDACEHFAPPALIQLRHPLPAAPAPAPAPAPRPDPPAAMTSPPAQPLISCVMPTGGRPDFARQAIAYFQRQEWAERELIVVDDGADDLAALLSPDPRIRYHRVAPGLSIGAKRNLGCELARGELIAHWDDDDWYAPGRLGAQAAPLLAGAAEISALRAGVFFDLPRWSFWECTPALHRRLFIHDVHGGTLVYRRAVWERLARYPDRSLAEDAIFLRQAVARGARLSGLPNDGLFVYLRHGANAWAFLCGTYLDPAGWQRVAAPDFPPADHAFYVRSRAVGQSGSRAVGSPQHDARLPDSTPLVSCIMPTADRRGFVPHAIRYFLRQDYPNCELVVVDDGADPVDDLLPPDSRIRYVRANGRRTLGAKRNLACAAASGELILHWDDDDWQAPWRVRYQAASLLAARADICGLARLWFYDPASGSAWRYMYPQGQRPWVAGNTLCYRKAFWRINPFPDLTVGEDTRFQWTARPKHIQMLPDERFFVALIHPHNTSPKRTHDGRWQAQNVGAVQALLGEDWAFYAGLAGSTARLPPGASDC
jgi:O-antigen biosynthesis protein